MSDRARMLWTFAITSIALVMVTLDNLVVTTALPVIRKDLHASIEGLEWTVNAYTLTFAVLLLTGAALGDRFGRRRMFSIGLALFTLSSAAAALAPSIGAIVLSLAAGTVLVAAFVLWELRTEAPMLPMRFFRNRTFALTNVASLLMFFGMFGSIFLLAQFFQTVQGYSPFGSGLRILPWTAMPIFVAPIAGALSDKIDGRPLMATGLALQATGLAWIAVVGSPTTPYSSLVLPFIISGAGMALFFAPVANVVLAAVKPHEEGQASGANNAIRELGGVFGVAVLSTIFASYGGYGTGLSFVDGLTPALWIGAAIVAVAALAAFAIGQVRRPSERLVPAIDEAD